MDRTANQPWIFSAGVDGLAILAPAWIVSATVLICPDVFGATQEVSLWWWLLLIVGIDVSHVYSTLFRTYLDRKELETRPLLYILTPLFGLAVGVACYSIDAHLFWRVLAYLAVFHFVRQQYGLLMLYGRKERELPQFCRRIDQATIYAATLYPMIYWHCHLPQRFDWFVPGEFLALPRWLDPLSGAMYVAVLILYAAKELFLWRQFKLFNKARNLLVAGTALSWFVGIVWAGGDLSFTFTNVIAHGVPYLALIWIFRRNQAARQKRGDWLFTPGALPVYLGILVLMAYVEEGAWDGMIWQEHQSIFEWSTALPMLGDSMLSTILVPLLALPQITHYLLDGLIWRLKDHPDWRHTLLLRDRS